MDKKPETMVNMLVDMDEVLVNISPKWIMRIYNNPDYDGFANKKKVDTVLDEIGDYQETLLLRDSYYIEKWLEISDPEAIQACRDVFDKDPDYYQDLNPTNFAQELRLALSSGKITVTVISHCVNTASVDSKSKWLKNFFGELPYKFYPVDLNTSKGDVVIANNISYNVFIDDMVKNIIDVATKTGNNDREFLLPRLGYNQMEINEKLVDNPILEGKGKFMVFDTAELKQVHHEYLERLKALDENSTEEPKPEEDQ